MSPLQPARPAAGAAPVVPRRGLPDAPLMVEQIRHVDARVRFRGAKVDAPNTPLEAVDLTLDLRDGVLKMAPLALGIAPGQGGPPRWHVLGPDVLAGETPQAVVPAGDWQAARADAGWAFVSCVVAPGFDFAGFTLAPADWQPE